MENPTGSVFCAHGTGYYVEWDKVADYAHIRKILTELDNNNNRENIYNRNGQHIKNRKKSNYDGMTISQEEIEDIFGRTFKSAKQKMRGWTRTVEPSEEKYSNGNVSKKILEHVYRDEYLLVDGYNIIFAWEDLRELAKINIDSARDKLIDILCNYQGYKKINVILVFDAYKVHGGKGSVYDYHNIHVVYTKEAETADQYIEKVTSQIGKKHNVTVATSDRLEQMIVCGQGARRLSADGLKGEIEHANMEIREKIAGKA